MKFMLMMSGTMKGWKEQGIMTWPREAIQSHIRFMQDLNKQLKAEGVFVLAEGLDLPDKTKIVRATKSGAPAVTDGPFAESKEFLAGYWVIDVESPEQAYAVAARASAAPGPGGAPLNMPIEVRQVMGGPPEI
jgi:hypothetical protein